MKYYSREDFTRDLRIFPYQDALLYPRWPLPGQPKDHPGTASHENNRSISHGDIDRAIARGLTIRSQTFRAAFGKLFGWIATLARNTAREIGKRRRIAATKRALHNLPRHILYDIGVHPGDINGLAHSLENGQPEDREFRMRR